MQKLKSLKSEPALELPTTKHIDNFDASSQDNEKQKEFASSTAELLKIYNTTLKDLSDKQHTLVEIFKESDKLLKVKGDKSWATMDLARSDKTLDATLSLLKEKMDSINYWYENIKWLFRVYANIIHKNDDRRKEFNLFVNTIVSLYDSAKPEVYEYPQIKKERDLLIYLKNIVNRKLDRDEEIQRARKEVDKLLDRSILSNKDLYDKPIIIGGKEINLGQLDFEQLKKEFPKKAYKNTEFTDLKEFMMLKLKQMMAFNKTRGSFLAEFEKVVDDYNEGSIDIEEAYEGLIKQAKDLSVEEERYIREGFESEEELEMFDLLKKDKLTKKEIKKVKKAAKKLLKIFQKKKSEIFVYQWYKENKKKEELEYEINKILHKELPESYNKTIFIEKKKNIYEHIYHLAESGDELYTSF